MSPGGVEHPKAKHELLESCIEVITGVCQTVGEATADLAATVDDVREQATKRGLGLMCSGSHPITDPTTQTISPNARYQQLVDQMQWLARDLQIFGVHVHVGVRSPDKVIPIVNALTAYIPHFLAISASSPYWVGHDTGLASARSKVFERLPTAGLPFQLSGWSQFEDYMETLISTKTIGSIKEVWWDIRPHPTFGTVELRICDGLPTLDEIGMVAAMSHCLVDTFDREIDKGYTLPMPKGWVVRENKWRAAALRPRRRGHRRRARRDAADPRCPTRPGVGAVSRRGATRLCRRAEPRPRRRRQRRVVPAAAGRRCRERR